MKHQKIEGIIEKRFEKINDAFDQARLHFEEDDIRIFRVKVKKLAAFLQLISVAKEHRHTFKVPQKIAKLNQLFGAIRTLQMQQNHVLNTIKDHKAGSPDTYLKHIGDEILQHMAAVNKHIRGSKPFKNAEQRFLKTLPRQLSQDEILVFVSLKGDKLEKLIDPVFPSEQSLHEVRKHLKNLLYISPYTELEINILSPYKLLSSFEDIDSFTKLLGSFHDINIALDCLHKVAKKIEPGENEKAILRRYEQIWMKDREGLRVKIYDEFQNIVASGRTVKAPAVWPVM